MTDFNLPTKFVMFVLALLLTACTSQYKPLPIVQCKPIGIEITHPDFYQKHKLASVEQFYTCMEAEVRTEAYNEYASMNPFQRVALGTRGIDSATASNQRGEHAVMALEYQRNLWRQVLGKEKKSGAAYESWIQWVQNERNISASNQAAANAADAARAARHAANAADAAQQQQFQNNFQLQQQNMQLQQMQQQQFMNGR